MESLRRSKGVGSERVGSGTRRVHLVLEQARHAGHRVRHRRVGFGGGGDHFGGSKAADRAGAAVAPASTGRTPTTLVAVPISVVRTVTTLRLTYQARLTVTSTSVPIANQYVLFSDVALIPGPSPLTDLLCETLTDANGVARCTITLVDVGNVLHRPTYTATYFGSATYLSSTRF